jgi:hypothetical protein
MSKSNSSSFGFGLSELTEVLRHHELNLGEYQTAAIVSDTQVFAHPVFDGFSFTQAQKIVPYLWD